MFINLYIYSKISKNKNKDCNKRTTKSETILSSNPLQNIGTIYIYIQRERERERERENIYQSKWPFELV